MEIVMAHPHCKILREFFLYLYICRLANDMRSFKPWGKSAIDSMIVTLPVFFFWGWKIIESPKDGLHWLFLGSQETQESNERSTPWLFVLYMKEIGNIVADVSSPLFPYGNPVFSPNWDGEFTLCNESLQGALSFIAHIGCPTIAMFDLN